jgi:hypothetical protein
MWGTPTARDDQKSPEAHLAMKARMGGGRTEPTSLTVQAKMWPTPKASEGHRGTDPPRPGRTGANRNSPNMPDLIDHGPPCATTPTDGPSGSPRADLNPRFVESLMGLPLGWLTPSTSVETASFRRWLRLHGADSSIDSGRADR